MKVNDPNDNIRVRQWETRFAGKVASPYAYLDYITEGIECRGEKMTTWMKDACMSHMRYSFPRLTTQEAESVMATLYTDLLNREPLEILRGFFLQRFDSRGGSVLLLTTDKKAAIKQYEAMAGGPELGLDPDLLWDRECIGMVTVKVYHRKLTTFIGEATEPVEVLEGYVNNGYHAARVIDVGSCDMTELWLIRPPVDCDTDEYAFRSVGLTPVEGTVIDFEVGEDAFGLFVWKGEA